MSNISVTTVQNTIEVTETGGITVTTPEGQTINVEVPNSTVNVTNTTDDITILTAGTLNINTGNAVTSVNGISGPTVVLDTDDISEGTTNKYFSQSLARQSLSAGTGISYDSGTGVITNTSINTDTTYTIASASTTGGANLNLVGSDSTTDSVAYKGSGATSVTSTDANTITISSTDTNTTYTQNASSTSGGANLNLVGSDSTTDSIKLAGGTNVTVTRTDADTVTFSSTDTNTTYTQNFSSTSGGTNLNLVGSDSTTDTVKFADGTGVTVSYTDANTATIAIGQSVGTGDSPSFAGGTFGNITVGVDTDNTIGTTDTNGNIILDPNGTGDIILTLADGGNLSNSRNYVLGAIRNATTESNGDAWSFSSGAGTGFRGITIDNSANTAKAPVTVLRSFTGGAVAGNTTTPTVLFERARGTSASPTAIQSGDLLGRIVSTGANGANTFIGDSVAANPASLQFLAAENFSSTTNVGTQMSVSLMPTGKTLASVATPTVVFGTTPQSTTQRSDSFTWQNGNSVAVPNTNTKLTLDSTGQLVTYGNISTLGTLTFDNGLAINAVSELLNTNTASGTQIGIQTNYRTGSGGTLSVPQTGWQLGNFRFNSNSDSSGTYVLGAQVTAGATENWTGSANGSNINFFANKQGQSWTTGLTNVISASPEAITFTADSFTFKDLNNDTNLTIDNSGNVAITGTLDVQGGTITESTGALSITTGASNGNITLDPNGTGDIVLTLANGGNLTNSHNYVYGAIRNATTENNGDHWSILSGTSAAYRGISLDNSIDTTKRPGIAIRSYGVSGGAPRTGIIFEGARGSAASPTNLNNGDVIGDIFANGYTSTGWASDQVGIVPGIARFVTTEAWNNGLNNTGTAFRLLLQPTATTLTTSSLVQALDVTPTNTTVTKQLTVANNRSTGSSDFATINFSTQKFTSPNYIPTSDGDNIGQFKFNGNSSSGPTSNPGAQPAASIGARATENWTSTANGTEFFFNATKTGSTDTVDVIIGGSDNTTFRSDAYTFKDSNSTNIAGGKIDYGRQYIEAYSTQDQTNPVANAENLMSFNNTGISNGISIVTNGTTLTRITMSNAGVYNIQFSAQLNQTTGGAHNAFIWLKKNGTTVADTAGDTRVAGNGDRIMAAWNYIVSAAAGDYYELAWAANDTNVVLDYTAAAAPIPAVPSVILTVVPVGA